MKTYLSFDLSPELRSPLYDELPFWSAPFGLKLLDLIHYKPGITALDIGFGTGFPLTEIAMRLGKSCRVYGLDPSDEMIRLASEKIKRYSIENIRLLQGVAEKIPLNDQLIDLVTGNNCINHFTDTGRGFDECYRVMKSGGQIIQTMNTDKTMIEFYSVLESVLSEMKLEKEIGLMYQHIREKRPPLDKIVSLFRQKRFNVKEVIEDRFCYKFTNGTAMLNHYFIRLAFLKAWAGFLPEDKLEAIFDNIETRLNEKATHEGGMTLSIPFAVINAFKQ